MSRVIVAGPRDLNVNTEVVLEALESSGFSVDQIVEGGAAGVDESAARFAEDYMIQVKVFRPRWGSKGRGAGPTRNRRMAEYADALVVIKRPGKESRGTSSMMNEARRAGIPTYIHEVAS